MNSINEGSAGAPQVAASDLYATPRSDEWPLRVSLLLPETVPAWVHDFIRIAAENRWLKLSVVQFADDQQERASERRRRARRASAGLAALMGYERLRGKIKGGSLAAVPLSPGLPGGMTIAGIVSGAVEARQHLAASTPELVLSLAAPSWADTLADCAGWGCWKLDDSLVDPVSAGVSLLAPMLRGESATAFELELQGPAGRPIGLGASWGATCRTSFLIQRERMYRKLPILLLRALHGLAAGELLPERRRVSTLQLAGAGDPLTPATAARVLAMTIGMTLANMVKKQFRRSRLEPTWLLMVRRAASPLDPVAPALGSNMILQAPPGDFWADPCAMEADGRKLVFVEEMSLRADKANIACLELLDDTARRVGLVLDEAGHLSYPQVFSWNDTWYMTVESSQARRVSLYTAGKFPLQWARSKDLVTGRVCVDPTLHFHESHWYLFATVSENQNSTWDELFLFVSEELTGPYRPHPANPILSDVRRARPAGRLFEHDGRLIRPSQDCATGYGAAVVFNEILELSPTRYREQPLSRLAPEWTEACHTYSRFGHMEVLDARGRPPSAIRRMDVVVYGSDAKAHDTP